MLLRVEGSFSSLFGAFAFLLTKLDLILVDLLTRCLTFDISKEKFWLRIRSSPSKYSKFWVSKESTL